jgi:hypothetical protein
MASGSRPSCVFCEPELNSFNASNDDVVASRNGLSNFWMEVKDSPSFSRNLDTPLPTPSRTRSLLSTSTCSLARNQSRITVSQLKQRPAHCDRRFGS